MDQSKINSKGIQLRAITIEDFPSVLKWSKDDRFCSANGWNINSSYEELYEWWLRYVENNSADFVRMGIAYNGTLIGYADLVDMKEQTAELGLAIGDSSYWGKGFGTIATKCMLAFASENNRIDQLLAETHETNWRARAILEKIGFREISRRGSAEYLGETSQLIQYSIVF
ncbi:GNAT family N-acetyltransferase [Lysinibacillus irui]|uniref:GNAT family N-acetyltransferase n=1 Tax=Lysinibacillus irui TaxID=2998077 RepID=A0AAJ5RKS4_9BACI|nr:GNAT family N-acetyltransferase [Lysinibacillus irui]MEA0555157.1 GNAT family N-acetyltransferase [Lysinibacillus irui]MEA0565081.1 GNAT family N-acetyltransferase [Lysinibacillus irui]MEA0976872.1 GNAT family N-acetyltransferase [Lysinibacillus irui]MEA1043026.1 GNAT family N-acetyltransferase [Lysinibacillus irui]WDV05774.1 GNAT family N-acetyltransferase [Lysinibacillus irui]